MKYLTFYSNYSNNEKRKRRTEVSKLLFIFLTFGASKILLSDNNRDF